MFLSTTLESKIKNKKWPKLKYCSMRGLGGDREERNANTANVAFCIIDDDFTQSNVLHEQYPY